MGKNKPEANELRKTLSLNIKKQRKIHGFTQEKLAEAANLSYQTINDIEGCRMWVSDKTIYKLSKALLIDIYELFTPINVEKQSPENLNSDNTLSELEGKLIRTITESEEKLIRIIKRQFDETKKQEYFAAKNTNNIKGGKSKKTSLP